MAQQGIGATRVDKTFSEVTNIDLPSTSQLRLFNIMLDEDQSTKFLNLFKTLKVNDEILNDISLFSTYHVEGESQAFWDNISYDLYGTPLLWWVVALFNDVVNPFEELEEGANLYVLKSSQLFKLFKDIEVIGDL
jgi:hypothetical protein